MQNMPSASAQLRGTAYKLSPPVVHIGRTTGQHGCHSKEYRGALNGGGLSVNTTPIAPAAL